MSCPHLDQHLRPDLDREAKVALSRHAEVCPECQHRLEVRREAYAILASDIPPLTPRAQAARWAKIEAATQGASRPSFGLWGWGLGVAAGLLVAAVLLRPALDLSPVAPAPGPSQPSETRLLAGQRWTVGELELLAHSDATLRFPGGPQARRILIEVGDLELSASAAPPGWSVETPHGHFKLIGAQVRLDVSPARSRGVVTRGQVELGADHRGIEWDRPLATVAPAAPPPAAPAEVGARPSPAPPAAPGPERASGASAARHRRVLQEARALIGRDDQRAVQIAEEVLARRPDAQSEVVALMIAADGWRRRGGAREAAEYYRQAIEHPAGPPFAEEASLRRATLLVELQRGDEALRTLEAARDRGQGSLAPERSALTARLLWERGRTEEAAEVLLNEPAVDRVLEEPRLRVAEAIAATDPDRARRLIAPIGAGPYAARVQALLQRLEEKQTRK